MDKMEESDIEAYHGVWFY